MGWCLSFIIPIVCVVDISESVSVMHYASILLIPFGISICVLYVILVKKLITRRKVGDKSVSSNASTVARASIQQRRVMVHAGVVTLIYVAYIYPPCLANIVMATVFLSFSTSCDSTVCTGSFGIFFHSSF